MAFLNRTELTSLVAACLSPLHDTFPEEEAFERSISMAERLIATIEARLRPLGLCPQCGQDHTIPLHPHHPAFGCTYTPKHASLGVLACSKCSKPLFDASDNFPGKVYRIPPHCPHCGSDTKKKT